MHDILAQIKTYIRGVWRHRWTLMGAMWFVCIAGWLVVYKLPDQYEATARVYVDTQSMLRPLLRGLAVQTSISEQIALMTRTLLSRPNLEKVARMTDLDLRAKTPEQMDALLDGLRHEIEIKGTQKVDLYTISYQNSDPQLAKRVVQSLLTIFVENSLGANRKDSDVAQQFLTAQVQDYESRLRAAEERLKEFKRKHVGLMPSEGKDYFQRLQEAEAQLQNTQEALLEAKRRRDELKRQLAGEEPSFGIGSQSQSGDGLTSPLDKRIQNMEERLDALLLKYTPQHPDVIALRRTIDDLKKQRKKELEQMSKLPASDFSNNNPVYQQMKIQVGTADADVAALEARYEQDKKHVADLRKMVNTVPQVEEDLAQLNRDYSINKKNYEELVSRLESAKLSTQADQNANDVQFKIIDPPRVPTKPSAPNRPLFMSIVLLGGIASGVALALFLSQIRVTFDNRRSLAEAMGLPVLGSVSIVMSRSMIIRRRMEKISYALITLVLVMVYSGLMVYQLLGSQLIAHVKGLIGSST